MAAATNGPQKNLFASFLPEGDSTSEETQGSCRLHIEGTVRGLCQQHFGGMGRVDPAESRATQRRLQVSLLQSGTAGQQVQQGTEADSFRGELVEELLFSRGAGAAANLLGQRAVQLLPNAVVDTSIDVLSLPVQTSLFKILPLSTSTIGWKYTREKVPIRDITDLAGHKTVLFEDFFRGKKDTFDICEVKTSGSPCQQISLPQEVKQNIATFINEHGSCKKCCCLDFVKAANGLHYEPAVWSASQWTAHHFFENQLLPGSTVALRRHKDLNLDDPAAHYAIYLADGLYLSKFGNGGPIVVTSLEAMHKFYHTDLTYVLTANKY